jgi:hypothetical protein
MRRLVRFIPNHRRWVVHPREHFAVGLFSTCTKSRSADAERARPFPPRARARHHRAVREDV